MNFRLAYKPRARLQTVNQLGQGNGEGKCGLRSKEIFSHRLNTDEKPNRRPNKRFDDFELL
jgi:hypothetical protein